MARNTSPKISATKTDIRRVLPAPEALLRHHGPTLFGPMQEWLGARRVPPVLLISGVSGVGKRTVAHYLAQWILCERAGFTPVGSEIPPGEVDKLAGCGECVSCRRALSGNWVDFTEITPESSSDGEPSSGALKIDQFRSLKASLGFGAHEGAYRITLIPNADRMTTQAANSVLKLLEEPPPGWVFFLTASDPTLLLPTVLSRCQSLRLKPLPPASLLGLLDDSGVDPARREVCARLAGGSWGRARSLASDEAWEKRTSILAFVRNPLPNLNLLVEWGAQDPSNFDLLVSQLEQISADLVRWTISEEPDRYEWTNSDGAVALTTHARELTQARGSTNLARDFWVARLERLARARRESLTPIARKLLVQDILLPWLDRSGN